MRVQTICQQEYLNFKGNQNPEILRGIPAREIVRQVWERVLPFDFPMWSGGDKGDICKLILNHYYMSDIGLETVAFWRHSMYVRLNEIMPYYIKLWEAEKAMGNIFTTLDITERHEKEGTDDFTDDTTNEQNGNSTTGMTGKDDTDRSVDRQEMVNSTSTSDEDFVGKMSDTPQNGLTDVISGKYLTEANVNSNDINQSGRSTTDDVSQDVTAFTTKRDSSAQFTQDSTGRLVHDRDYTEDLDITRFGFQGIKPHILQKYYNTVQNIQLEIVRNVGDLFFGILG